MNAHFVFPLALFASTALSITLFVLAMPRHHAVLVGGAPGGMRAGSLKWGAWFMLALSLLIALSSWNGGISLILWFALLSFQAFAATMVVTYAARYARMIVTGVVLAFAASLFGIFTSR